MSRWAKWSRDGLTGILYWNSGTPRDQWPQPVGQDDGRLVFRRRARKISNGCPKKMECLGHGKGGGGTEGALWEGIGAPLDEGGGVDEGVEVVPDGDGCEGVERLRVPPAAHDLGHTTRTPPPLPSVCLKGGVGSS